MYICFSMLVINESNLSLILEDSYNVVVVANFVNFLHSIINLDQFGLRTFGQNGS